MMIKKHHEFDFMIIEIKSRVIPPNIWLITFEIKAKTRKLSNESNSKRTDKEYLKALFVSFQNSFLLLIEHGLQYSRTVFRTICLSLSNKVHFLFINYIQVSLSLP